MEWGLEFGAWREAAGRKGVAGAKCACEHFPVQCGWVWTAGEVGKMSRYFGIISLLCAASLVISEDTRTIKTGQGKL